MISLKSFVVLKKLPVGNIRVEAKKVHADYTVQQNRTEYPKTLISPPIAASAGLCTQKNRLNQALWEIRRLPVPPRGGRCGKS